jgi:hypothetical protein
MDEKENNITHTVRLTDADRLALELGKANKKTAIAIAEKAIAQNETAELAYKYTVLQIYMKYGLSESDAISETGEILKGGAVPKAQ